MRAVWNGAVIAESDDTVQVDGYTYFPLDAVREGTLKPSEHHSVCHWKGQADYFSVVADGKVNENAAWTYPDPSKLAIDAGIQDKIAFWKGVQIEA